VSSSHLPQSGVATLFVGTQPSKHKKIIKRQHGEFGWEPIEFQNPREKIIEQT